MLMGPCAPWPCAISDGAQRRCEGAKRPSLDLVWRNSNAMIAVWQGKGANRMVPAYDIQDVE